MLTSGEPGVFAVVHLHFEPAAQCADIHAAALVQPLFALPVYC
jgi:hypothetical protein